MVRIIIDKKGVFVDDAILTRLAVKCERVGFSVRGTVNDVNRALIVLGENVDNQFVINKLNANDKAVPCKSCTTIFIRGTLLPGSVAPFRCPCGKWIYK